MILDTTWAWERMARDVRVAGDFNSLGSGELLDLSGDIHCVSQCITWGKISNQGSELVEFFSKQFTSNPTFHKICVNFRTFLDLFQVSKMV